jgi:hypothetical protein
MYCFRFYVSGWENPQYIKANTLYEAYSKAEIVASGKNNYHGLVQLIGAELRDAIANNFNGCLHD